MNIRVTKRAERNYKSIRKYITNEFGENTSEVFDSKTIDFLDLLSRFPSIGFLEVISKDIRGFQLTRQTKVLYRIKNESIIILNFFDVRQSPAKKFK